MLYREEAAELFMKYVPRSGWAETEQGELIRAVAQLATRTTSRQRPLER